jgi:hypothetical protein
MPSGVPPTRTTRVMTSARNHTPIRSCPELEPPAVRPLRRRPRVSPGSAHSSRQGRRRRPRSRAKRLAMTMPERGRASVLKWPGEAMIPRRWDSPPPGTDVPWTARSDQCPP